MTSMCYSGMLRCCSDSRLTKVPDDMRNYRVFEYIERQVNDFYETIPLLTLIADKSMLPRHFERIGVLTGRPFDVESPECTLGKILEAKIFQFKEDVEDICISSVKEKDIETKLIQVIGEWTVNNLSFSAFKDKGDLFLKPVETLELVALIEDSVMTMASLAANRYNIPFKAQILEWLKKFIDALEILESWLNIQNIWGYLEAVYAEDEISRQLPEEAAKFKLTDERFVNLILKAQAAPNAIEACTSDPKMKRELNGIGIELEQCQKSLSGYLEQKRSLFPRFFFVSDPTLLEILSQGSDSHMIRSHLLDVFENIAEINWNPNRYDLIEGIISQEQQALKLTTPVLATGGVEMWLNNLLKQSRNSLSASIMECWEFMKLREFQKILEMTLEFIAQVGLLGVQVYWTYRSEYGLVMSAENTRIMRSVNDEFLAVLNTFIDQTTQDLTKVERTKYETLVTIHVHQRDIFGEMVDLKVKTLTDFQWLKQARFYIDDEACTCSVKITDVSFQYQMEFLGCQERLVVTPLTDRCYITCAQAISMNLGAAPAGPAGTGKTETTKDMGRTLGKYVVVFNCSDQMDFRGLGRIFKGLAQSGSWGCFDEFNRIELPVLSVAAQQIGLLLTARKDKQAKFIFSDGDECVLNPELGLFITMNPGYAGRQELPENIKYQFRSMSMMVPDRQIIKRVRLAASGFKDNVFLARKFFTLYALCEEQLSKQVHYDFGLRNILSVLRTLGSQKRADPSQSEEKVVMRVLRDMNLSKLVDEDEPLFLSLIDDLFLGLTLPSSSYADLQKAIEKSCLQFNYVNYPSWNLKVVQMYETSLVRHGLMLLGPTGAGKSCIIRTLMQSLTTCGVVTKEMRMNPKAITAPQMFGKLDVATNDWTDGIFSVLWRRCHKIDKSQMTWLILDGPVDAVWIENLNSVLDDNKTLTLANGDRIKMAVNSKLVFEPDNVDNASPATVSRMGMTFVSSSVLPWRPCFEGWCKTRPIEETRILAPLIGSIYADLLALLQTKLKPKMNLLEALYIRQTCDMLCGLIQDPKEPTPRRLEKEHYEKCLMFALMWSVGAVLEMDDRKKFQEFVMNHKSKLNWPKPVGEDTIFEFKVTDSGNWEHWNSSIGEYLYPAKTVPDFLEILVPNVDNVRTNYLISTIARIEKAVLLIGEPGTAKTVMVKGYMKTFDPDIRLSKSFNFSSATTPNMVQRIIESYIEKRVGTTYGPPNFRKMTIFIDDISMPVFNDWGDQVTNEITRQLMEQGGFFSLEKPGEFAQVLDIHILAAMIHPGGGRNDIPPRLKRRFCIFNCTLPSNNSMDRIFSVIGQGYFSAVRFGRDIVDFLPHFVGLTRTCWQQTKLKMLPTPAKFHYIFNLRDLSRIWQGMCIIRGSECKNASTLYKLWRHECMRTISDRFVSQEERDWFANCLETNAKKMLPKYDSLDTKEAIFVDFLREAPEPVGDEVPLAPKIYELVPNPEALAKVLRYYQKQYNADTKGLPMDLVFFKDFVYHLIIISRIIRTPKESPDTTGRESHLSSPTTTSRRRRSWNQLTTSSRPGKWLTCSLRKSWMRCLWDWCPL
uniref:Dynein heavy chain 8, axonemal n=2 Tax=Cacopsylla melanoneura TaxID=428564 RepID=A0A8D8LAT7_9HEMI